MTLPATRRPIAQLGNPEYFGLFIQLFLICLVTQNNIASNKQERASCPDC